MQDIKIPCMGGGDPYLEFDQDGTLAGNSDKVVPTQKAVKNYVDVMTGGVTNPSGTVFDPAVMTVSGALPDNSFVQLNHATVKIAATAFPTAGRFLVITQADAGTAAHTVTLGPGTYDGTNNTATFNAPGETLVLFGLSSTRFAIVLNLGSVGLSNV